MRNYIRTKWVRIYPLPLDPNFFYVVCGGKDEDQFNFYVQRAINLAALAPGHYTIVPDFDLYFLLDDENFVILINQNSGQFWTQTHLNNVFAPIPNSDLLYDVTRVQIEGSPRPTWSHGH
jgi:hypothetical protein